MSIEINTGSASGAKSINWEEILSSLGEVKKVDSVDGRESFTVTISNGGETSTVTVNIPDDLEIPENVDSGTLQSLVEKLSASGTGIGLSDEQVARVKDAIIDAYAKMTGAVDDAAVVSRPMKGGAMFNLYALMALMVDVAQSQRNAQRDIRTSQNLSIQKSYQDQADQQRDAANLGMWVGIGCGLFSAACSIGIMAGQGYTAKQQANIVNQTGLDAAKMQSSMLQNTDSKVNAQTQLQNTMNKVGDGIATDVSGKFDNALSNSAAGDLRGNLGEALHNRDAAQTRLDTAKTELATAEQTLAAKTATRDQLQARYDELGGDQAYNDVRTASIDRQNHIVERMNAHQ